MGFRLCSTCFQNWESKHLFLNNMEPKVQFKGGGSFVDKPPQFSADGQYES